MYIPEYTGNQNLYTGWRFANWRPTVLLFDPHNAGEKTESKFVPKLETWNFTHTNESGLLASLEKSKDLTMLCSHSSCQ